MTSSVNAATGSSAANQSGAAGTQTKAQASADASVNKETFLRLLVAQIRHQNPLNPADGIQFLSQLAQFSQLEQMMEIRKEVETIRSVVAKAEESGATSAAAAEETSV